MFGMAVWGAVEDLLPFPFALHRLPPLENAASVATGFDLVHNPQSDVTSIAFSHLENPPKQALPSLTTPANTSEAFRRPVKGRFAVGDRSWTW